MNLKKGTVTSTNTINGQPGRTVVIVQVGNREIFQITLAQVATGDELNVDLDTTRIYRDGVDITHTRQLVMFTGTVTPQGDGFLELDLNS